MKVLAGSFAERGSSPKQKALLEQLAAFETAMTQLEGCCGLLAVTVRQSILFD